jgi:hypothetical protein
MNFLEMKSIKSQKPSPNLRILINTFTGNGKESERSEELKRILKSKNYKVTELIDINQELIFERSKSKWNINSTIEITSQIRDQFHKQKLLYKLNSKFSLPQITIGDDLVLSFEEFELLNECGLFDKIMNGSICNHIRIFNNEVVYSSSLLDEFSYCIYCYSLKKKKQIVTLIANVRDNNDEENNEILSYCEGDNLTIKLVDYENYFSDEIEHDIRELCRRKEKAIIIERKVYPITQFFDIFEKIILKTILNFACLKCGKKVSLHVNTMFCISCLSRDEREEDNSTISENAKSSMINLNRRANKPYHFVEKLKLKRTVPMIHASEINESDVLVNTVPKKLNNFNISFRK